MIYLSVNSVTAIHDHFYFVNLIKNHPFVDCNKRTAVASASSFMMMNGFSFIGDDNEFVKMAEDVASSDVSDSFVLAFMKKSFVKVNQ